MTKKLPKFIFIEAVLTLVIFLGWYLYSRQIHFFSIDLLVDLIFVIHMVVFLVFKNPNSRHFWYAFLFLVLSALTSLIAASTVTSAFASLALSFLFIGVINQMLFGKK